MQSPKSKQIYVEKILAGVSEVELQYHFLTFTLEGSLQVET